MAEKKSGQIITFAAGKKSTVRIAIEEWEEAMEDQNRARAIMGDILIGIMLAKIIKGIFPRRTKDVQKLMNGINMVQKARLAYILGIIDKMVLEDLKKIQEIRNKFGHSFEASFADTKVLRYVRNLSTAKGKKSRRRTPTYSTKVP